MNVLENIESNKRGYIHSLNISKIPTDISNS